MFKEELKKLLTEVLQHFDGEMPEVTVDFSSQPQNGDYASNIAMVAAKRVGKNPMELAEEIKKKIEEKQAPFLHEVSVARPGFINFKIKEQAMMASLQKQSTKLDFKTTLESVKFFIEYAHPNTHKEMHIGHMRTLITGEAVARLAEAAGAEVFRANYQGDIGLHVAKALYGIEHMMKEQQLSLEDIEKWGHADKAHFLGQGYALGSRVYETEQEAIDYINKDLYKTGSKTNELYKITRKWSLDYYDEFYARFYTKFNRLFFESEVADEGVRIVNEHLGKIFEKQNGAIVFPGEKYGLHTRVFITHAGNPTYEGKEMGNAFNEYNAFHFDRKVHVVGNEQAGYFQVVFKALELIDPEKFKDKQHHISMGMVQFSDRKMSSRTGDVLRVDWLIDQVKERVKEIMSGERIPADKLEETVEQIAIGAIKYSVLQVGTGQNVAFDINKSVSLDGKSGPYIQYAYARTQSVLKKSESNEGGKLSETLPDLSHEERELLRLLAQYEDIVAESAVRYAPNILATYLFDVAQAFNLFYQKSPILKAAEDVKIFRLKLTKSTGNVIKNGLYLLGIKAPDHM